MKQLRGIVLLICASVTVWGQDVQTFLKLADSQVKAGQFRQAVISYQKVISLDPDNSGAYEKLGDVYGRLNMPGESATAYEKAADLMLAKPAPRQAAPQQERRRAAAPQAQAATSGPAPAAPVKGGGGGGLEGLYLMTRFWVGSGLEIATYRFHDGTVILNPVGSAKSLDLQAEQATHPNNIGTYRLQGGQLVLSFPDGKHEAKFEPESKGCFGWNMGIFCSVEAFKPGTTLDGTFSGGASVGGGAVMSSTSITFRRDGTYQRESAGSFATQGSTTAVSGGSVGTEHGKYRIDGTALYLMPDGGRESVVSTFPYDDGSTGPAPRRMYFGGGMLKRER